MKLSTFFILTIIFFLSKGDLLAQSNFGPTAFSTIEIMAGGGQGYRQLIGQEVFSRDNNEIPADSWMAGVRVNRRITNRLWLGLGANFTNVGYRTHSEPAADESVCSTPNFGGVTVPFLGDVFVRVPNVGLVITPSTTNHCFQLSGEEGQEQSVLFNGQRVEIPLTVRYEVDQLRFRPFIEAGLTGSYTVRNSVREKRGGEVVKAARQLLQERNRFGLGFVLSVGATYGFNENYSIFAQPVYRYSFSPTGLTTDVDMSEYSRSLMIQVGIRKDVY